MASSGQHLLLSESKDWLKAAPEFKYDPGAGWVKIEGSGDKKHVPPRIQDFLPRR
jgi:hypothetical protein